MAAWLCFGQRPALEAKFNEYETIIKAEESKPFKTIEWYKATAAQKNVQAQKQSQVADVIAYLKTPARWTDNPLDALMMDQARADERNAALKPKVEAAKQAAAEALATAKVAQDAAAAGYQDAGLNDAAKAAIDSWQSAEKKASKAASGLAKPFNRIPTLIVLGLVLGALCTVGAVFMGMNPGKFFVSFLIIYALCVLANILGNQKTMRLYGINAEIWSIAIGMIIANTIGTPKLVKDGAPGGILHQGRSGAAGCRSAVPQDPGHRYSRHLRGLGGDPHRAHQHLHLRPEGAQDAFPYPEHGHFRRHVRVRYLGGHRHRRCLPRQEGRTDPVHRPVPDLHCHHDGGHARLHQLGGYGLRSWAGAWIGGVPWTPPAPWPLPVPSSVPRPWQVAATVKMIQNVLIGVTAFCVAMYWCAKVDVQEGQKVSAMEIWHRFPKFVLGFLTASIVMSRGQLLPGC